MFCFVLKASCDIKHVAVLLQHGIAEKAANLINPNKLPKKNHEFKIVNEAVLTISNIAGETARYREKVLDYGAMTKIIQFQKRLLKMRYCHCKENEEREAKNRDDNDDNDDNDGKNSKNECAIILYLDNTTWAMLNLVRHNPPPPLIFRKQPIVPLADVLLRLIIQSSPDSDDFDEKSDWEHGQKAKINIIHNICCAMECIIKATNFQQDAQNEEKGNDNDNDLKSKSTLELIKESKILEYVTRLVTDSRLSAKERNVVVNLLSVFSVGSADCIDYLFNIGILDVLGVCMDCTESGYGCSDNKHYDDTSCFACGVVAHACSILTNICNRGTPQQFLQLIQNKKFNVGKKLLILLNQPRQKLVMRCVGVIANIVRNIQVNDFKPEMAYLISEVNILPALSQLLNSTNATILRVIINCIQHILVFGGYLEQVNAAGIFKKVWFSLNCCTIIE